MGEPTGGRPGAAAPESPWRAATWRRTALAAAVLATLLAAQSTGLKPGAPAPLFSRTSLDHHPVSLADYRGKVVLLNFWASWCEPCMTELPAFKAWQTEYAARGLQVVAASLDDSPAPAAAAARKLGLNFPVVMADVPLARLYGGVYGVPMTFLIGRRGHLRLIVNGAANLPQLQGEITALLKQP